MLKIRNMTSKETLLTLFKRKQSRPQENRSAPKFTFVGKELRAVKNDPLEKKEVSLGTHMYI